MGMCVRNSENSIHDRNTINFVAVHELAHIGSTQDQHPREFWRNFKILLQIAEKMNYVKYHDYKSEPVLYCNEVTITYNPLDDNNL